jgi:enoyl-[acyl-carrier protein] reductase II
VRLIKNDFYKKISEAESRGANTEEIKNILGKGRAKKGIMEGDLEGGELEIGQGATFIKAVAPASEILLEIWTEYLQAKEKLFLS